MKHAAIVRLRRLGTVEILSFQFPFDRSYAVFLILAQTRPFGKG